MSRYASVFLNDPRLQDNDAPEDQQQAPPVIWRQLSQEERTTLQPSGKHFFGEGKVETPEQKRILDSFFAQGNHRSSANRRAWLTGWLYGSSGHGGLEDGISILKQLWLDDRFCPFLGFHACKRYLERKQYPYILRLSSAIPLTFRATVSEDTGVRSPSISPAHMLAWYEADRTTRQWLADYAGFDHQVCLTVVDYTGDLLLIRTSTDSKMASVARQRITGLYSSVRIR